MTIEFDFRVIISHQNFTPSAELKQNVCTVSEHAKNTEHYRVASRFCLYECMNDQLYKPHD